MGATISLPGPAAFPSAPVIGPTSKESMGHNLSALLFQSGFASAIWPAANRGIGYPFMLTEHRTLLQMYVHNGTVVSGNLDAGVFREDGTKVVAMGATAQAGTSALQLLNVTDTVLQPWTQYYAWLAIDNITATTLRVSGGVSLAQTMMGGVVQMASAYSAGLVATVTAAAVDTLYLPDFGMVFASTV